MARYFHLLWDEDLDELREVLKRLRDRHGEVVARWYQLYLLHFGDERTLPESEFRNIFEPALVRDQDALLRKDMDAYAANVVAVGRQLAQRRVPLEELIAAVHLLEEAAQAVFPRNPRPPTAVNEKFDKLSQIRLILLVGAYSRLQSAAAAARIDALEMEQRNLPPQERSRFHGLVGRSPVMRELYRRIEAAGRGDAPLLVLGEPGTGKELAARAVHECSACQGPFVALRCAALPSYLIGNELFGYQRQSANGGQTYLGLYAAAAGGTLLLDEITRLPVDVQDHLAQILGTGPCGRARATVRIVASSSFDLDEALRVGQLRKDFIGRFDRRLRLPPLREHRADIVPLARHFVDLLNHKMVRNTAVAAIDDAAMEAIERYAWPGNVQELFDAMESAFVCAHSALIGLADLPSAISGVNGPNRPLPTITFETFADAERAVLKRALEITGGNKLRAARLLKISRKKLYSGIAKYGLKPADV